MKLTDAQVVRAMNLLGILPQDFRAVDQASSFEEAQKGLVALKAKAKAGFRRAAFALHPDRTNNDPAKTEDFRIVSTAVEDIEKLQFVRRQPPPQQVVQFTVHFGGVGPVRFTTNQTTTTTTSSGFNYWGGSGF